MTEDVKLDETTKTATATAEQPIAEKPSAIPADEMARLTDEIVGALKTVYDPEIPADIYELGLIYKVDIDDDRMVSIDMTLTTPNCPSAAELPAQVENAVAGVPGVREAKVDDRVGSAVGSEPDVGRGPRGPQYVVSLRVVSCEASRALHE